MSLFSRCIRGSLAALTMTLAACSAGTSDGASSDTEQASTTTPTPAPPAGLMMRSGSPPGASTQTYITSSVSMINWGDVQAGGAADQDWSTLDASLAALTKAGVSHARLRVMSGGHAPTWVKRLGAPDASKPWFQGAVPTSVIDCSPSGGADYGGVAVQNVQGPAACVPYFWSKAYLDAYAGFMRLLRARLDSDPVKYGLVSSVVDSACMAVYAEVFYRGQGDGATNQTLYEAGLTHDADVACQKRAITIHKNVFGSSRRTSVAINDWDIPQGTPGTSGDYHTMVWNDGGATWATYQFAEWAKTELDFGQGTLLEVQNNGLHTTSSCASGDDPTNSYFCYIAAYSGRHGFQTQAYQATPLSPSGASLTLLEDLDNGLRMHAEYIELPSGMSPADWRLMGCYDQHIRAGNAAPCPH